MRTVIALLIALLFVPATAAAAHSAAAPPPNDNRANATRVDTLPAALSGTTVGATDEKSDPTSYCGRADDTVWYRISGTEPGRIVVTRLPLLRRIVSTFIGGLPDRRERRPTLAGAGAAAVFRKIGQNVAARKGRGYRSAASAERMDDLAIGGFRERLQGPRPHRPHLAQEQ